VTIDDFELKLSELDTSVFTVDTSTSQDDRRSLLRIQGLARSLSPRYFYLEIGSYLGGSLVPHLLDPKCRGVVAVDRRPLQTRDERAKHFSFRGVTTERMLEGLRPHVNQELLARLKTFDSDMSEVPISDIGAEVDLAFIDGEHTVVATFRDFTNILPMLSPNALVAFHDTNLILDAISNIEALCNYCQIPHRLFLLPKQVGCLALRGAIDPAKSAFEGIEVDREQFTLISRRRLYETIAKSVAQGLHLK
jgi:hypothetical protein